MKKTIIILFIFCFLFNGVVFANESFKIGNTDILDGIGIEYRRNNIGYTFNYSDFIKYQEEYKVIGFSLKKLYSLKSIKDKPFIGVGYSKIINEDIHMITGAIGIEIEIYKNLRWSPTLRYNKIYSAMSNGDYLEIDIYNTNIFTLSLVF